ncbi:hypothetical protein KVR01_002729 [Diaporthe batatas]|uniref:uncharacterized protein n=1 Tax=Diaporthe batatas TaxID=748121 RepID=UPI001D03C5E9|nr:uncharacterized protein KVR01_002729 [Diaporthe batatas]KAG8167040.1 hypothetical protein KVR01_002729 [Diaporthe batatas]
MFHPRKPTIAIAGLAIETSTFHAGRTEAEAFHPRRGTAEITAYHAAVLDRPYHQHPASKTSTTTATATATATLRDAANWVGALTGHALPGGQVSAAAYAQLEGDLLARLRATANLLRRIRGVVGPACVVSASMDLHGNVSRGLAHLCDLLTCYRTAPHVDVVETRARACENLLAVLARRGEVGGEGQFRPFKAWVPVPILLPGEQTSTRDEPARSIYAAVPGVEAGEGVLDASVWVGYAWADAPRDRAAVVVTGWDEGAAGRGAEALARLLWDKRGEFHFVAPTGSMAECLDTALGRIREDRTKRPFFISDSGDNPTAGASGFNTWGLAQVLARDEFRDPDGGPRVIYASVPHPHEDLRGAVVGAALTVTLGNGWDPELDRELTVTGRVHSVKHGDKDAGTEVVLRVGSVFAILTDKRKPYHKERDFTDLDLEPREADIVIVKIGYLEPELYDMANDWMLGLTPGGVDQDLVRLGHREIRRPMFPMDKTFEKEPDLSARIIAMSNEPLEGPDE